MTSSGTYSWSISNGELVLAAYERIQVRAPSLRQEHMVTARRELNLLQSAFSNLQPNLWKVVLYSTDLTEGTATYDVLPRVVMILDAYVSLNQGDSDQTDRTITAVSRSEYASYALKQTQGFPTIFWFDRTISPTVTLYPVPDGNGPYTLNYYACLQMEDANLVNGQTPDAPYRFLDALVAALAHRVSRVYAPQLEMVRKADADDAWRIAATQDTENVAMAIAPGLSRYYR